MADKTKIEWSDATWNPVTGCTKVSPGCDNCYAETFAERWRGTPGHYFEGGFDVQLRPERLDQPLRWKKPRKIFVNSMSDLFHDSVPDEFIANVFAVMAVAQQHTFQLLTKRHGRMRSLLSNYAWWTSVVMKASEYGRPGPTQTQPDGSCALLNVWVGVSVEDQKWAEIRIPALLETPAAMRWISAEPLLGPLDLREWLEDECGHCWGTGKLGIGSEQCPLCVGSGLRPSLGWVVAGGESGPGARPMHPDWPRSLRDQCQRAEVPFLFKQHGEWEPIGPLYGDDDETDDAHMEAVAIEVVEKRRVVQLERSGYIAEGHQPTDAHTWLMARVGKARAGRLLDGETWDQFPEVPSLVEG